MELWVGLAELRGNPNCKNFRRLGKNKGAFVWVAAWAASQGAVEANVKVMSESLDCILYGLEEVGLLDAKMEADNYPEEFINMRATAIGQRQDTQFLAGSTRQTGRQRPIFRSWYHIRRHILCPSAFAIIK